MHMRSFKARRAAPALVCALTLALVLPVRAQTAPSASRGELLYATHCGACHSVQMHWREQKLATSWSTLRAQVRRWQGVAQLGWSETDVDEVARYLNATIYRYPEPARVGAVSAQRVLTASSRSNGER
jgi:mono/diheme cytochrome c family protein